MDLTIDRINYAQITDDTDLLNRVNVAALEAFTDTFPLWNSPLIQKRPLAQGAWSYRFKLRGHLTGDPSHHTAGQFVQGRQRVNSYADVFVDRPLFEAIDLDGADTDLSNYDEVAAAGAETVRSIADLLDRRAFRLGILAARTASVSGVHNGGNVVQRIGASVAAAYPSTSTGADNFADDMASLARLMDEDNVPEENRFAFITPYMREVATKSTRLMNRDYNGPEVSMYAKRYLGQMEGFNLILTRTHMPSTNVTTDVPRYNGNFTAGAASQRQPVVLALAGNAAAAAIGGVIRYDIRTKVYMSDDHNAMRIQSWFHGGLGICSPWCAGEIGVATGA